MPARPHWLGRGWSLPAPGSLQSGRSGSDEEATQSAHVPSEGERAGFQRLPLGLRLESKGRTVTPEAPA